MTFWWQERRVKEFKPRTDSDTETKLEPHDGLIVGHVIQLVCDLEDMGSTYDGQIMCHLRIFGEGMKSWEKSALLCRDICRFILHIINDTGLL